MVEYLVEWVVVLYVVFGQWWVQQVEVGMCLGWCGMVVFYCVLWCWYFVDWYDWCVVVVVQYVQVVLFGWCDQCWFDVIGGFQVEQGWLVVDVYVLQVVVGELVVLVQFVGVQVEGYQVGVEFFGIGGVVVVLLVGYLVVQWQVDLVEFFVDVGQ